MVWAIELDSSVEKQLEKLAPDDAKRILKYLRERVAKDENPRRLGEALVGTNLQISGGIALAIIASSAGSKTNASSSSLSNSATAATSTNKAASTAWNDFLKQN